MQSTDIDLDAELEKANQSAAELIHLAEGLFGPMSSAWEYVGVAFCDHPPHLHYFPESGTIQIWLSLKAIGDEFQRDFQLAHEICHLLYPSVSLECPKEPVTIVINEGISTYFSILIVGAYYGEEATVAALRSLQTSSMQYFAAFQKVSALLNRDREAIKKIRAVQPMVNELTVDDLLKANLGLDLPDIELLVERF